MDRQMTTYYYHVYRDIVTQIYLGTYKKGQALPSMRELCSIYQVGRNTVRSALALLEERGYIEMEPKKLAVVTFDMDNPKYRDYYLTELAGQKQAVGGVFDFMELFMPELFVFILERLPRGIRMELARTAGFYGDNMQEAPTKSEQELARYVMQLYRLILVMANNQLMEHMFESLYYFIQLPVFEKEFSMVTYKAVCVYMKTTFKKCQRSIEAEDYGKLKKLIAALCQTQKKRTCAYLNKICKGIEAEEKPYYWSGRGAQDTEYIQMASNIMIQITDGTYAQGDIIPSYAQLAEDAGVSEQTSRNAIDLLNRLKVVSTINGLGTKAECFQADGMEAFLADPELHPLLISFLEALQILGILCEGLLNCAVGSMTKAQYVQAEEKARGRDFREVFQIFMPYVKQPAAREIYHRLMREMVWGNLLDCGIIKEELMSESSWHLSSQEEPRQASELIGQMKRCCLSYFDTTCRIAKKHQIKVRLLPGDPDEI